MLFPRSKVTISAIFSRLYPDEYNIAGYSGDWPGTLRDIAPLFSLENYVNRLEIKPSDGLKGNVSYYTNVGNATSLIKPTYTVSTLGIDENFLKSLTPRQAVKYINNVRRSLALLFHPDHEGGDQDRMKAANTAADELLKKYGN